MSFAIETHDLTKTYEGGLFSGHDVHALKKVNLNIEPGEIFGYLGPNGSGKTTTIKMLLGLIFPTSGTIKLLGSEDLGAPEVRRRIGFLPEGAYYPDFLRGEEILEFYGKLYGLSGSDLASRISNVLDTVGMTYARKRLMRGYSKGMRQRIGLAQALICDPDLLILDEPTTGLDPLARTEIRDILANLRNEGKTLLISSHELLEVELISNRVAILFQGEIQTMGTLAELLSDRDVTIDVQDLKPDTRDKLKAENVEIDVAKDGGTQLRVPTSMSLFAALDLCKNLDVGVLSVAPRRETLEELFVRTVGDAQEKLRGRVAAQSESSPQ